MGFPPVLLPLGRVRVACLLQTLARARACREQLSPPVTETGEARTARLIPGTRVSFPFIPVLQLRQATSCKSTNKRVATLKKRPANL